MWGKDQWGGFCQAQAQRFFWGYWKLCVQFKSCYVKYFPWKVCQNLNQLNWTTIIERKVKVYFLSNSFVSFTRYCCWAYIPFYFGSVKALKTIICFLYSISRQKKCWMRKKLLMFPTSFHSLPQFCGVCGEYWFLWNMCWQGDLESIFAVCLSVFSYWYSCSKISHIFLLMARSMVEYLKF